MGILESTFALLFRPGVDPHKARTEEQKTNAILRPIIDQAVDVADCIIDREEKANDPKATPTHRR